MAIRYQQIRTILKTGSFLFGAYTRPVYQRLRIRLSSAGGLMQIITDTSPGLGRVWLDLAPIT